MILAEKETGVRDYRDVEKLVEVMSYRWSQRTGIPMDECRSAAHLAYVEADRNYNPERGVKFSTYLYRAISFRLVSLTEKRTKERSRAVVKTLPIEELDLAEARPSRLSNLLQDLGDDARIIFHAITDGVSELASLGQVKGRQSKLLVISEYLQKLGWGSSRIDKGFAEIREVLGVSAVQ